MATKSPKDADRYVGMRIRVRRTLMGMSQERLGELLGVTFQQIQKYEKGANRIGVGRLVDIAAALDVPIVYFFEGLTDHPRGFDRESDLQKLMMTREGIALARAFTRIPEPSIRQSLVHMAEVLTRSLVDLSPVDGGRGTG